MTKQPTSAGVAGATLILIAGAVLLAVTAGFAFVSGLYWHVRLADQPDAVRWGLIGLSVAVSFAGAFGAIAAGIKRNAAMFVGAFIFMGLDCVQNAYGLQELDRLTNGATEAQARYDAMLDKLVSLPNPSATGEIRNKDTYLDTQEKLGENITLLKTELEASETTRFELWQVMSAFAAAQFALLMLFGGLGRTHRPEPQESPQRVPVPQGKNVHVFKPKVMDERDQKAWAKVKARSRA
ncbi:hypothetical protein D1231_09055 [Henriciella mobilis]|uniref:hypothetical protein n=1 Tax=Henriciella mobilis TaxID=2305467 RepID=UPI000E66D284|nr:hypothetical protein [Henriciella mobilis]RIJ15932.1 hypothetical protein D1231_09055 [Henriciella mobilis]